MHMNTLNCAASASELNNILDIMARNLRNNMEFLSELMSEECQYGKHDCEVLILESLKFIGNLPKIIAMHKNILDTENEHIRALVDSGASIRHEPHGKILLILPSNAPLPLAIVLPLALGVSGNSVILAGSSRTKRTIQNALNIFDGTGISVSLWGGTAKEAVSEFIEKSKVDLCYFTGSSKLFPNISNICAQKGIHLIFEGEGNGSAIIDKRHTKDSLVLIASMLIESCRFCLGKMCSKPTAIFIPEEDYDFFIKTIKRLSQEIVLSCSVRDAFSAEEINRMCALSQRPTDAEIAGYSPVFIGVKDTSKVIESELYGPGAFIVPYSSQHEVLSVIQTHSYKMQVSVFSSKGHELLKRIENKGFARTCINMQPIAQNINLPWGCYGLSGCSDVHDFYRKGLKRTLVERSTLESL